MNSDDVLEQVGASLQPPASKEEMGAAHVYVVGEGGAYPTRRDSMRKTALAMAAVGASLMGTFASVNSASASRGRSYTPPKDAGHAKLRAERIRKKKARKAGRKK